NLPFGLCAYAGLLSLPSYAHGSIGPVIHLVTSRPRLGGHGLGLGLGLVHSLARGRGGPATPVQLVLWLPDMDLVGLRHRCVPKPRAPVITETITKPAEVVITERVITESKRRGRRPL